MVDDTTMTYRQKLDNLSFLVTRAVEQISIVSALIKHGCGAGSFSLITSADTFPMHVYCNRSSTPMHFAEIPPSKVIGFTAYSANPTLVCFVRDQ